MSPPTTDASRLGLAIKQYTPHATPSVEIGTDFSSAPEPRDTDPRAAAEGGRPSHLAVAMKGQLTVKSIVGVGSEFTLTLPRAVAAPE